MGLEIRGANELRNKLERLATGLNGEMTKAMEKEIRGPLPPYPPERPGQKYRRTYNLQRTLNLHRNVRPLPSEVQGLLGSLMSYAPYVIDKENQAWMHRGRWWTLQDQAIKLIPAIAKQLQAGIRRLLE